MPACKRCGRDHFNFLKECPPTPKPVPMTGANPWGTRWGNAPTGPLVTWAHPMRLRTGTLTLPPDEAA